MDFSSCTSGYIVHIMKPFDTIIVGAGALGCAIARELSQFNSRILVIEKHSDVGFETSSRNSGVLHSGIHDKPGTLRAYHAVRGNNMTADLCRELGVPHRKTGKLTVAHTKEEEKTLERLFEQGEKNGVPNLAMIGKERMQVIQPGVTGISALHSPSTGIISPYEFTIALAEQAHDRGVQFSFDSELVSAQKKGDLFHAEIHNRHTQQRKTFTSLTFINAAGLGAASISRMLGADTPTVYPCRGEYYVIDKRLSDTLHTLIYPVPGHHSGGLGIHLTQTTGGVILIGPSSEYIQDSEDTVTTSDILERLKGEGKDLLPGLSEHDFIRAFSGIRPKLTPPELGGFADFIIDKSSGPEGSIMLLGIESPGLTAAASIALEIAQDIRSRLKLSPKVMITPAERTCQQRFMELSPEKQSELIRENPEYGEIVCRCENITKAEVKRAIDRIFGPVTYNGIKLRCRAMMGRCQGGFCLPRIAEILHQEYSIDLGEHHLKDPDSPLFHGFLREVSP